MFNLTPKQTSLFHHVYLCFLQGGREVDDFIKYLARESTDGIKVDDGKKKKKKSKKTEL